MVQMLSEKSQENPFKTLLYHPLLLAQQHMLLLLLQWPRQLYQCYSS
jgi:hypothetical protein